jgi:hypothetical protein
MSRVMELACAKFLSRWIRRADHPCSAISHTASSARTVCNTTRAVAHPDRTNRRSTVLGETRLHRAS